VRESQLPSRLNRVQSHTSKPFHHSSLYIHSYVNKYTDAPGLYTDRDTARSDSNRPMRDDLLSQRAHDNNSRRTMASSEQASGRSGGRGESGGGTSWSFWMGIEEGKRLVRRTLPYIWNRLERRERFVVENLLMCGKEDRFREDLF
jgi:hypothetical protein